MNDGKKVIQEGLEILRKIRSISAKRKFVVLKLLCYSPQLQFN